MRNALRDVCVEKLNNNYIYYLKEDTVSYNILQKTKEEGKGFFPKYNVDEMIKTVRRYGDTAHVFTHGNKRYISIVNKEYGVINKSITLGSFMGNIEHRDDGCSYVIHPITEKMFVIYENYEQKLHSIGSASSYLKAAVEHYEVMNMRVILGKDIYFNGLLFKLSETSADQVTVHPLSSGFDFETEFSYDEKSSTMQQLEYRVDYEYVCSIIVLREHRFDKGEITLLTQDHDNRPIRLRFNPTEESGFDYLTFQFFNGIIKSRSEKSRYVQNALRTSMIAYTVNNVGCNRDTKEIMFGMNEEYRERMNKEKRKSENVQLDLNQPSDRFITFHEGDDEETTFLGIGDRVDGKDVRYLLKVSLYKTMRELSEENGLETVSLIKKCLTIGLLHTRDAKGDSEVPEALWLDGHKSVYPAGSRDVLKREISLMSGNLSPIDSDLKPLFHTKEEIKDGQTIITITPNVKDHPSLLGVPAIRHETHTPCIAEINISKEAAEKLTIEEDYSRRVPTEPGPVKTNLTRGRIILRDDVESYHQYSDDVVETYNNIGEAIKSRTVSSVVIDQDGNTEIVRVRAVKYKNTISDLIVGDNNKLWNMDGTPHRFTPHVKSKLIYIVK